MLNQRTWLERQWNPADMIQLEIMWMVIPLGLELEWMMLRRCVVREKEGY
jgi:hypothetical protein